MAGHPWVAAVREDVATYTAGNPEAATRIALAIPERISSHQIRDWRDNDDSIKKMRGQYRVTDKM